MNSPRRADFARALARSFSAQASWNRRAMTGTGLAHALAPLLARIHAGDEAALRAALERHAQQFNAHPYLVPVAVGAAARLEREGADPRTVARFRAALGPALGALGDEAVWSAWRPFCTAAAALAFLLGAGPLAAAAGFLALYNAGHAALRAWGLRLGWREGRAVGAALGRAPLRRIAGVLARASRIMSAAVAALAVARLGAPPLAASLAVAAGLSGYLLPRPMSGIALASLLAGCAAWLL